MSTTVIDAVDAPPLRFDRRRHDRWPADGAATAFELASDSFGRMHTMRLRDFSDHGLAGWSRTAITPGTSISIGFQQPGCLARRGVVLRCTPCGDGYEIGVAFEQRMAA